MIPIRPPQSPIAEIHRLRALRKRKLEDKMFRRILTTAIVFGMAATAPPAMAQTVCGPRDHIVSKLDAQFMEQMIGGGLVTPTSVVEIWTSPDAGTWTMLVTNANGKSCVLTSGTDWRIREIVPETNDFSG